NRLARFLIARGAGPERVVALLLARGVDLVVAQLAVAKTGAAFLPVDPAYPPARVAFMLDDAKPVLVLANAAAAPLASTVDGAPVVLLDEPRTAGAVARCPGGPVEDGERR